MKEMTIEQKAKAYDKAIEHARSLLKTIGNATLGNLVLKNEFKNMFPVLEESEDEMIRKALITYHSSTGSIHALDKFTSKEICAWLEKQDKPIDKIVKRAMNEKQRVLLTETNGDANIDWDTRSLQDVKLLLEYGLDYIKKLEKQGKNNMGISEATKQKLEDNLNKALEKETPESWSEFLDEQGKQKPVAKYKVGDTIYYDSFGRLVSFVIANIVEDGTDNPMYEDKDGNSVFQNDIVEQKPAWSEEDERMYNIIVSYIPQHLTAESYTACINWLKGRYTWKPSDLQLECLSDAIKHYNSRGYDAPILKGLLNELRKLKG